MAETAVSTSMADSIRAAMKEVSEKEPVENTPEPVEEAPAAEPEPVETSEAAAERARDKAGRFAAAETAADKHEKRETLTLKPKEVPNAAKEQERAKEAPAEVVGQPAAKPNSDANRPTQSGNNAANPQGVAVGPPAHWNGSAKIDWNKIPGSLRESIAKDYEVVGKAQTITAALQPYEQKLTQMFGGADRGVAAIMSTWEHAQLQPLVFMRDFCQKYGIDPQQLAIGGQPVQGQSQEQQPDDPYGQRFQRIETALQHIAQQPVIHQQQQIQSDIQSFQTALAPDGSVEHPYFNDVRAHMAALMQTPGGPTNLKEAYDQACWANPNVRVAILKEQETAKEAERRQAIARAQGAAVSVSGAPGVNGAQPQAAQSVSDTLRTVYRAAKGGRA